MQLPPPSLEVEPGLEDGPSRPTRVASPTSGGLSLHVPALQGQTDLSGQAELLQQAPAAGVLPGTLLANSSSWKSLPSAAIVPCVPMEASTEAHHTFLHAHTGNGAEANDQGPLAGTVEFLQTAHSHDAALQQASSSTPHVVPTSTPDSQLAPATTPVNDPSDTPLGLQLQVGSETLAGHRKSNPDWVNQDTHLTVNTGPHRMLAGVFDGHGQHGHHISAGVRDLFAQVGPLLPAAGEEKLPNAMARLFAVAEEATERTGLAEWSGTTAVAVVVDALAGVVSVAHVGDSRLLVANGPHPQVTFQTADHIVDAEAQQRVLAQGGDVRQSTISGVVANRVFLPGQDLPGLNMARALGDTQARSIGVSSEPTITAGLPISAGSVLVVASDGVWEKVPPFTVASIALSIDAEAAAQEIVRTAKAMWLVDAGDVDDITVVVIKVLPVQ